MIAALRQIARQRGVTLLRLIQIAAGVGLEESVLIEHVLAYAGDAGTLTKSWRQWEREIGISRRAIGKAHRAMPRLGIDVSVGSAGKMLRVTIYHVGWNAVRDAITGAPPCAQGVPISEHNACTSVGTECEHQCAQGVPISEHNVFPPFCSSSSSSEKETQESEESLTTTTSSTPTAYELLTGAGVYPTIANRYRDQDPDAIRRLIHYANDHAKLPAAFIAAALLEGFTPPARQPTQDELYYDFIER